MSDRCFSGGSLILCVSLPGPEAVLAWSRFCRFPDGSGLYSLPGLETLPCRVYCTCTAAEICTCTADRSTPARPVFSSHPLYFGVFQIKILFFTRYWISSFLYRDNLLPSTLVFCARHISTVLPFVVSRFCILFCFLPVGLFVILKTCLPAIGPTPHSFLPCRERYEQQAWVQQGGFFTFGSETSALRSIPGTSVKWLIMVIFWIGLAEPFKSRTLESLEDSGLQESLEDYINLALHLCGSAFRV